MTEPTTNKTNLTAEYFYKKMDQMLIQNKKLIKAVAEYMAAVEYFIFKIKDPMGSLEAHCKLEIQRVKLIKIISEIEEE